MHRAMRLIIKIAIISLPFNVVAWHDTGHMVVAEIAYRNLDNQILANVDHLISSSSKEYPKNATFVNSSVWADDIKQHGIDFFNNWHYHDRYFSEDGTRIPKHNNGYATKMLTKNVKLLTSERTTKSEKAFALKMVIHLVGDMHQPMHNISAVSRAHPDGDLGGNLYKIKGQFKNLHSLWDSALENLPRVERPLSDADALKFSNIVDRIIDQHPMRSFDEDLITANYLTWQTEGYDIAKEHAYSGINPNMEPSANYLYKNGEIAKQRLALAGYRLSSIINCAWGSNLCIR